MCKLSIQFCGRVPVVRVLGLVFKGLEREIPQLIAILEVRDKGIVGKVNVGVDVIIVMSSRSPSYVPVVRR